MASTLILAAPPWHWWLGVFFLVLDVIILIGLGILYRVMVIKPQHRHGVDDASARTTRSRVPAHPAAD
jgi:hypothetical protein